MTPSWPEYTKTPPQSSGNFYFLIEKTPLTAFLYKNIYIILTQYNSNTFCEE
jgi:hypothetical protein